MMMEIWWDESDGGAWILSSVDAETGEEIKRLRSFPVAAHDPEDVGGGREVNVQHARDEAIDTARLWAKPAHEDDDPEPVRLVAHDGTVRYV
jgi:hypothetical protein